MILSELASASKIMIGSQLASKIYIGSTLIYSASRLPNGYTELAYISSTSSGGLYIDTGCKMLETTDDVQLDFKFKFKGHGSTGVQQSTLFCSLPEASPYPGCVMRILAINAATIPVEFSLKWNIPNKIGYTESNKYYYINFEPGVSGVPRTPQSHVTGELIDTTFDLTDIPAAQVHQHSVKLFCAFNSSNLPFRFSEADIYYLKITKGGVVLREFIPAKRNSDDEVGLYDILNDVFYPSQGANSFVGTALS